MMVPVNQNIDEYKDDFFKGLTKRQTMYAIAAVVVSGGLMAFFLIYLKMNASVAMYITLPIVFPIIAVGFIKIHGMNFRDYLLEKRKVKQRPVFFYEPELVYQLNQGMLTSDSDDIIPDDAETTLFRSGPDHDADSSDGKDGRCDGTASVTAGRGTAKQGKLARIFLQTEESIAKTEDIESENVIENDEFAAEKGGDSFEANEGL